MNELQRIEPLPTPVATNVEAMITLAIERGATVETIERLMAIRREVRAEQAKQSYDRAMAEFQADCPTIEKTKVVKTDSGAVAYKYAPIECIVLQVKEALKKHGFSYSTKMELQEKGVKAIVKVTHEGGHSKESPMEVPFGSKTKIMSDSQVAAAATTFAKRYAFCNAFGILTGDEDIDGRIEKPPDNQGKASTPRGNSPPKSTAKPPAPAQATEKQKARWLALLKPLGHAAVVYGWEKGWILGPGVDSKGNDTPGEPLEVMGLEHVPTGKTQAQTILGEIQARMDPAEAPQDNGDLGPQKTQFEQDMDAVDEPESELENGVETVTGKLEQVSVKEGRSSKGPWKRFGLRIGKDFWVNTFSATLGKLAEQDKGSMVRVLYKAGEKGNDLVSIERAKSS